MLHEPGSYVGEVVKLMSKKKILVKVQPEGKYVVDFDDKLIKLEDIKPNLRVALRNDTYALHKVHGHTPRPRSAPAPPAGRRDPGRDVGALLWSLPLTAAAVDRSCRARSTRWLA